MDGPAVCKICYGGQNTIGFYIPLCICHTVKPHFTKTTANMKVASLYPIFIISTYSLNSDVGKKYVRFIPLHPLICFIHARYTRVHYIWQSVTSAFDCTWCTARICNHGHATSHTRALLLIGKSKVVQYPRHSVKDIVQLNRGAPQQPEVCFRNDELQAESAPQHCCNVPTEVRLVLVDWHWTLLVWRGYWTAAWWQQMDSREGEKMFEELQCSPQDGVS